MTFIGDWIFDRRDLCYHCNMQLSEAVTCPYCGQTFELEIDTSAGSQMFVTDCEVCCRPFEVAVECEPGEILSLDVRGN